MYDILKKYLPQNEEKLSEKRADNIKAAVLSRIKEEKAMRKHISVKTLSVAAAAAAMAAVTAMAASAEKVPMSAITESDTARTAPAEETPKNENEKVLDKENADTGTNEPGGEKTDLATAEIINVTTGEHYFVTWNEEKGEWDYPDFMSEKNIIIPWDNFADDVKVQMYVSVGEDNKSDYYSGIVTELERAQAELT